MKQESRQRVIVIGAGLGGLSAAVALATAGYEVEILEKNDKIGGKLNVLYRDGFTFDLGPSILTMPHIFQSLFHRAGKQLEDYIRLQAVTPHWRNFFEDGTVVDLHPDPTLRHQELRKLGPDVSQQFERFLAYSKRLCDLTEKSYFARGFDSVGELLKHYGLKKSVLGFDVFRTMDQGVKKYVKHPKLIDILNYFVKYVGSSPYDAPALLNLLPAIQINYGLWYVRGGMYRLAEGIERLAEECGVHIRLNTEVQAIQHTSNRVQGVTLIDGTTIPADLIVSNMEIIPAMQRLFSGEESEVRRLRRFAPSCSGLVMHFGIDTVYPQLAHHNFFYSQNPKTHFRSIFQSRRLSEDPTIYVVAPVKSDPSQAPDGCEIIKVLPHVPHIDPKQPLSDVDYLAFRERVLMKLERMGLTNLRKHIVCEETWSPLDIQSRYYSNLGSIYGVVSNRYKNLGFKAPQRSRRFRNLYFVGASVNPGAGMPMVTLSGLRVADKILADRYLQD